MKHKKAAVVVLSGGQDSTTCLFWAKQHYDTVHAVTFDYGQRHISEIYAARRIARWAGLDQHHEVVSLSSRILKGTSPLVSGNVEVEMYENYEELPGGLEKTFVPMRNQLFLTLAANRAYVLGTNVIVTGVSAEDYGGYPDCTPRFIESFIQTSSIGTFTGRDGAPTSIMVRVPLIHKDKRQTVQMAMDLDRCYEALALSHTSYSNGLQSSSKDHAALLRNKGFEKAMIPDPLVLREHIEFHTSLPETPNYVIPDLNVYLERVRNVFNWMKST